MNLFLKKTNDNYYQDVIENMKRYLFTSEMIIASIFSFFMIFAFGLFGIVLSTFMFVSYIVRQETLKPISELFSIDNMGKSHYYMLMLLLSIFVAFGANNAQYNIEYRLNSMGFFQEQTEEQSHLRNINDESVNESETTKETKETIESIEAQKHENYGFGNLFAVNYLANIVILWCVHGFASFFLRFYLFKEIKGLDANIDTNKVLKNVYSENHKKIYYFNTLFGLSIFSAIAVFMPILSYTLVTIYGSLYTTILIYNHLFVIEKENHIVVQM